MSTQADDTRAERAGFTSCWSCKGPVAGQALFCHTCDASEALKDPRRRAAYLLGLKGVDAAVSKDETVRDPELLMEAMEAREALMEANSIEKVEKLQAKAGADAIGILSELSKGFASEDLKA